MFLTNKLAIDLAIAAVTLFIAAYFYIKHKYSYWVRKGIPQLKPTFPLGNHGWGLPRGFAIGAYSRRYYDEFIKMGVKDVGGVYLGLDPYMVILDPKHAKNILISDFQHFTNRGLYLNRKSPISVHLLSQEGEEWKASRSKFTSLFTSSKMKYFFNTMKQCRDDFSNNLKSLVEKEADIDIHDILGCYFTDIVGSVIYGVEANSFKHPDAIFRKIGKALFVSFTKSFQFQLLLSICYPNIAKMLNVSNCQADIEKFFNEFVPEAIEYRRKNNIHRADFLQLLMEMLDNKTNNLTMQEIISQTFIIFTGGFETSSTAATLLLYELGKNKEIQEKTRNEIRSVCKKYNGDYTYDSIKEMTYLHQVFTETARKYPGLPNLTRVCIKDYNLPNTNIVIEKDTPVIIPTVGLHYNPDVFPNPEKFDPDRFKDKNVKYDGFFPFGDGPRNCIGARLGLLQVKLALTEVIGNYEISVSPKTQEPLKFDEYTFVSRMETDVYLKLKRISED